MPSTSHSPGRSLPAEGRPSVADKPNRKSSPRAVQVDRRWRRAVWWVHGRIFWRWWGVAEASVLAGSYLTFLILFAEPALWPAGWRPPWVAHPLVLEIGFPSSLSLLLFLPFSGLVVDGALTLQHPPGLPPRRWVRFLRFACASLPLLNLYVFPLWRLLLQRQPTWAFGPEPRQQRLLLEVGLRRGAGWRLRARRWGSRFLGSGWLLAWLAVGFLVPLWWTICLTSALAVSDRHLLLVTFVGSLHLAAVAAVMVSLRPLLPALSRGRVVTARTLPWLWLLPLPGPLAGYVGLKFAKLSEIQPQLVAQIYSWRGELDRQADWRGLQITLHDRWRRLPAWRRQFARAGDQRAPSTNRAQRRLQTFCRLKSLLLVLDVTAAVTILAAAAGHWPAMESVYDGMIVGGTVLALLLMGIGLLVLGVGLAARLTRAWELESSLARRPWGRYLFLTQLATLAGLGLGHWLARDQAQILSVLCLATVLGVLLAVLFAMVLSAGGPPRESDPLDLLWALAILAMVLSGALALADETIGVGLRQLLAIGMLLLPVWHFTLAGTLGRWLLRPYEWRELLTHRLSRATALYLWVSGLITVLPLGGLLLPIALILRPQPVTGDAPSQAADSEVRGP